MAAQTDLDWQNLTLISPTKHNSNDSNNPLSQQQSSLQTNSHSCLHPEQDTVILDLFSANEPQTTLQRPSKEKFSSPGLPKQSATSEFQPLGLSDSAIEDDYHSDLLSIADSSLFNSTMSPTQSTNDSPHSKNKKLHHPSPLLIPSLPTIVPSDDDDDDSNSDPIHALPSPWQQTQQITMNLTQCSPNDVDDFVGNEENDDEVDQLHQNNASHSDEIKQCPTTHPFTTPTPTSCNRYFSNWARPFGHGDDDDEDDDSSSSEEEYTPLPLINPNAVVIERGTNRYYQPTLYPTNQVPLPPSETQKAAFNLNPNNFSYYAAGYPNDMLSLNKPSDVRNVPPSSRLKIVIYSPPDAIPAPTQPRVVEVDFVQFQNDELFGGEPIDNSHIIPTYTSAEINSEFNSPQSTPPQFPYELPTSTVSDFNHTTPSLGSLPTNSSTLSTLSSFSRRQPHRRYSSTTNSQSQASRSALTTNDADFSTPNVNPTSSTTLSLPNSTNTEIISSQPDRLLSAQLPITITESNQYCHKYIKPVRYTKPRRDYLLKNKRTRVHFQKPGQRSTEVTTTCRRIPGNGDTDTYGYISEDELLDLELAPDRTTTEHPAFPSLGNDYANQTIFGDCFDTIFQFQQHDHQLAPLNHPSTPLNLLGPSSLTHNHPGDAHHPNSDSDSDDSDEDLDEDYDDSTDVSEPDDYTTMNEWEQEFTFTYNTMLAIVGGSEYDILLKKEAKRNKLSNQTHAIFAKYGIITGPSASLSFQLKQPSTTSSAFSFNYQTDIYGKMTPDALLSPGARLDLEVRREEEALIAASSPNRPKSAILSTSPQQITPTKPPALLAPPPPSHSDGEDDDSGISLSANPLFDSSFPKDENIAHFRRHR